MKRFKKFLAAFALTGMLMVPAPLAAAQQGGQDVFREACRNNPGSSLCQSNTNQSQGSNSFFGANGVLIKAARLISLVVGVAAVIMIIIGGIRYILSAGDPSSAKGAKDTILYALVGLVVAASAQGIIVFVVARL